MYYIFILQANSDNITTEITNLNKTLPVTTSPKEVPGSKEDHDSIPSEIPASENVLLTDIEPQSVVIKAVLFRMLLLYYCRFY